MASHFLFLALFALAISHAFGSDPSQLQDFCVADPMSQGIHAITYQNPYIIIYVSCIRQHLTRHMNLIMQSL